MPTSLPLFPRRSALAITLALGVPGARAASFPDRPVRLVSPFAPGSPAEALVEVLAPALAEALGVPVSITARLGGGGTEAIRQVVHARADGYVLLVATDRVLAAGAPGAVAPDPLHDLAPVALASPAGSKRSRRRPPRWIAILAPGGTPAPVVARLNAASHAALAMPEPARALRSLGLAPVATRPPELAGRLRAQASPEALRAEAPVPGPLLQDLPTACCTL